MRLRPFTLAPLTLAIAASALFASPALAETAVVDGAAPPRARVIPAASAPGIPAAPVAHVDPRAKAAWLGECRRRVAYYYGGEPRRGNSGGIIGAVLGGIVGGVAGNRIDNGPDRAAGTIIGGVVGATVGAVAGSAIERSAERRRAEAEPAYDYCEAYFDDYYARQTYAMAYAPQPAVMMVPVAQVQQPQQRPCVETVVTEEIVPVRRARAIPRRRPAPDKRLPM